MRLEDPRPDDVTRATERAKRPRNWLPLLLIVALAVILLIWRCNTPVLPAAVEATPTMAPVATITPLPTPTAYIAVSTPILTLTPLPSPTATSTTTPTATPDVLPLELPTMRPMPTSDQSAPRQIPRR